MWCACMWECLHVEMCACLTSHTIHLSPPADVGLFRVNREGHVVKFEDVDSFHVFRLLNPPEGEPQMPHIMPQGS